MGNYKVTIKEPFLNCERIYPVQQKKVKEMLDYFAGNDNIESVTVFGSSVTDRCHVGSDLDIYVCIKEEKKLIDKYFPFAFDLWTNFSADDRLKKEIEKTGVVVYEKP